MLRQKRKHPRIGERAVDGESWKVWVPECTKHIHIYTYTLLCITECTKRKFKFVPRPMLSRVRARSLANTNFINTHTHTHIHFVCCCLAHFIHLVDCRYGICCCCCRQCWQFHWRALMVYVERESTYKWFRLNGNCFDIMDQFFTLAFPFQRVQRHKQWLWLPGWLVSNQLRLTWLIWIVRALLIFYDAKFAFRLYILPNNVMYKTYYVH